MNYNHKEFQSPDELTNFLNENAISRHQIVSISQGIEGVYKTPSILLVYETASANKVPMDNIECSTNILATIAKCGISIDDLNDMLHNSFFN